MTHAARLIEDLQRPWRHSEHLDARGLVLDEPLTLDGMEIRGFDLSNAHLRRGMSARTATFLGLAWLEDTTIDGSCDLTSAQFRIDLRGEGLVTDSLLLDGVQLLGILDLAWIRARRISLTGAVVMANLTLADAEVAEDIDLSETEVMGGLWADGARLGRVQTDGTEIAGRVRGV